MLAAGALLWSAVRLSAGIGALALISFVLLQIALPLQAQNASFEGRRIAAVRLDPPGNYLVPDDRDKALNTLEVGTPLSVRNVRATIEQLYATGRFADIEADATLEGDAVIITFKVTPSLFVRNVVIEGVEEPPSLGQLGNATELGLGERFEPTQLRQSVEGLMETLRSNGFYLANITPATTTHRQQQQVDIGFSVETGTRAKYSLPIIRGTPNRTAEEIVKATRWRRFFGLLGWKEVTEARTGQGLDRIRRLYQKRDFLMARVTLEQMEYRQQENQVVPTITIDSGPKVVVQTRGAKISRGRLRELVPIYQELTVDRDLLVEGKRELTEHLQARGFFDAQVDFDMVAGPDETVIEYALFPGERHKLVFVGISGNKYFTGPTLRERLYVTPATLLRFRRGRFSQDYLRRDVNALRALYDANGFRDVQVKTRIEDDYQGKQNEVAVFFEIEEGPQWRVASLDIEGVDNTTTEDLRAMLQSTEGQPYSDVNVATDRDSVLSYFFNNGYPDATLDVTATESAEPNRMMLRYTISTGSRQIVRDVLISGLRTTDRELVRQRILLEAGDPLSLTSIVESQRRLYDLGIFARVDTAVQDPTGETDNKFVLYRFEEASKISITGGFGAQIARIGRGSPSFDTPAGTAGFSPRVSLGVSRSNFRGVGHTVSLQTRLSNIQRRGLLTYLAPQFKGNEDLSLTFTGIYDDLRDVQTFNSRRQEGSIQLTQRLTKANTAQYRLAYKRVGVSELKITPALIPLFSQPVQLGTTSFTFIQDRRDDAIDARRGIYNTIDLALASNFWADPKITFARALGRNATYHRVTREVVFARSTSFGFMTRVTEGDVPLPERFFAGGATSHRGFPDNQTGPRDPVTGFPLGGKALLINNHELRFPLLADNIGGVFFHDAGNVYSDLGSVTFRSRQRDLKDFNYMVHAVGFGIRYRTPIGPVRVDLAYSMNSPRFVGYQGSFEELLVPNPNIQPVEQRISRFQFHFSLGQLF